MTNKSKAPTNRAYPKPPSVCQWFLRCTNPATGKQPHPILGEVPICDRCRKLAEANK